MGLAQDLIPFLVQRLSRPPADLLLSSFASGVKVALPKLPGETKHPIVDCHFSLAVYAADLAELWDVLCLRPNGLQSDCRYIYPSNKECPAIGEDLSDCHRSEQDVHEMLRLVHLAAATGDHGCITAVNETLAGRGMIDGFQEPFAMMGFANMGMYGIYGRLPTDVLHQDYNGISTHLYTALYSLIDADYTKKDAVVLKAIIRSRLYDMRLLHKAVIPTAGLEAEKLMAEDRKGTMKFMAIALHGLVDPVVVKLFTDYARYQQLRDQPTHSDRSLELLDKRIIEVAEAILAVFGRFKNWQRLPKFQNLRKYPSDIRQFGFVDIGNTGPKEAGNKMIRLAAKKSNYKNLTGTLSMHVAKQLELLEKTGNHARELAASELQVSHGLVCT
ncbi:hypothetical protein WJX74_008193 [Apatococcus lobatus]|uniref:Uncharacterized protein n=1 Tax=Apatococcus lobatus TaxID=904363 RepID=A0AAW1QME9_9CHLO